MAYSAPSTISTGDLITASIWNQDVVANPIAIYAGAMSVTSQAVGDILYASSTTQFARIAAVATGQVLTSAGTGTVPAWSSNVDLGGTLDVTGATTLDSTLGVVGDVVFNDAGAAKSFRVETDGNANMLAIESSSYSGVGTLGIGGTATEASLNAWIGIIGPATTAGANDAFHRMRINSTVGGAVTIPSGTAGLVSALRVDEPNITATGTVTEAASLYVSGAPSEGSSNYALFVDGGDVRIDEDLGVGTDAPNYTSASRAITLQAATQARFEIVGTRTSDDVIGELLFMNRVSGTNNNLGIIKSNRVGANNSGSLSFHTYNAGSVVNALTIAAAGNVGIGATSPAGLLAVAKDTDKACDFGKGFISSTATNMTADRAHFGHVDCENGTDYALVQPAAGATTITCTTGNAMWFGINAGALGNWSSTGFSIGKAGTGATAADAILHVYEGNAGTHAVDTNCHVIFESDGGMFAEIKLGTSQAGGFMFATPNHPLEGGMYYAHNPTASASSLGSSAGHENGITLLGTTVASGDFNDTSDEGLKENVRDIVGGLSAIAQLHPVTFDWIKSDHGTDKSGFIAQEVEEVLPNDVVGEDYTVPGDGPGKAVNTVGILAHAVRAIQELKARIEILEGEHSISASASISPSSSTSISPSASVSPSSSTSASISPSASVSPSE